LRAWGLSGGSRGRGALGEFLRGWIWVRFYVDEEFWVHFLLLLPPCLRVYLVLFSRW
jgi:hypothetical protein